MRVFASARAGVALLVAAGCGGSVEPPASVSAVVPRSAHNDAPIGVLLQGGPFRPAFTFDTLNGRASIELGAFTAFLAPTGGGTTRVAVDALTWRSTRELAAQLPAALAGGLYDVELRDPRGNVAVLPAGFESLGPDLDPPTVTVVEPASGAVVAADTSVPMRLRADDGVGRLAALRWTVTWRGDAPHTGSCPIEAGVSQASCEVSFVAPTLDLIVDSLTIDAEAEDAAGNRASTRVYIWVGLHPQVFSFAPSTGPATGMTEVTVNGANFIDGTRILIDDVEAEPNGGTVDGPEVMRGNTPPHDPGLFPLVVRTGSAEATAGFFEYVAQPILRAVWPSSGPLGGGTPVEIAGDHFRAGATRIFFGPPAAGAELVCPSFVSEHLIGGFVPPGAAAGPVSVFAVDPVAGQGAMLDGFAYADGADAAVTEGGAPPAGCGDRDGGAP